MNEYCMRFNFPYLFEVVPFYYALALTRLPLRIFANHHHRHSHHNRSYTLDTKCGMCHAKQHFVYV